MDVCVRGLPGGPVDDVHRVVVGDQLRHSAAVIMPSKRSDQSRLSSVTCPCVGHAQLSQQVRRKRSGRQNPIGDGPSPPGSGSEGGEGI